MIEESSPAWLPSENYMRVTVSCTARLHGGEPRRLPDRTDAHGTIASVLVDNPDAAAAVFRLLDQDGRTIYVDVERKQAVNLLAVALNSVTRSTLAHLMPNSTTVRSLDVVVTQFLGPDLSRVSAGVYGTGNLAFKSALLLAERNARVFIAGRSRDAVRRNIDAINGILPRYAETPVAIWKPGDQVDCMVGAVAAHGAVGVDWLDRLHPDALVIDVGIGNFDEPFIAGALAQNIRVVRLDARATESQLPLAAPDFFTHTFGTAEIGGVPAVAGGVVGARGTIVVDNLAHPTCVVGVANGVGGLVPAGSTTPAERERMASVNSAIRGR